MWFSRYVQVSAFCVLCLEWLHSGQVEGRGCVERFVWLGWLEVRRWLWGFGFGLCGVDEINL